MALFNFGNNNNISILLVEFFTFSLFWKTKDFYFNYSLILSAYFVKSKLLHMFKGISRLTKYTTLTFFVCFFCYNWVKRRSRFEIGFAPSSFRFSCFFSFLISNMLINCPFENVGIVVCMLHGCIWARCLFHVSTETIIILDDNI